VYNEKEEHKEQMTDEDYQEVDRRIIRHFPLFLKELNQEK
jgi:hypothetical protein